MSDEDTVKQVAATLKNKTATCWVPNCNNSGSISVDDNPPYVFAHPKEWTCRDHYHEWAIKQ